MERIKIEVSGLERIKRAHYSKFILTRTKVDRVLHLFDGRTKHGFYAPKKASDLIGAGLIFLNPDNIEIEWGSNTISEICGFDRPENPGEAEKVAHDIRGAVVEWCKSVGL
jgi:hypothetical protein